MARWKLKFNLSHYWGQINKTRQEHKRGVSKDKMSLAFTPHKGANLCVMYGLKFTTSQPQNNPAARMDKMHQSGLNKFSQCRSREIHYLTVFPQWECCVAKL